MINRGYTYCAKNFIVGHISRVYHPGCGMTQSPKGPAIWVLVCVAGLLFHWGKLPEGACAGIRMPSYSLHCQRHWWWMAGQRCAWHKELCQ